MRPLAGAPDAAQPEGPSTHWAPREHRGRGRSIVTISVLIDRIYWGVLLLAPLGYALLNLEAFKKTGKRYLLFLLFLDLVLFGTTTLMFLIRYSDVIQGDIHHIQKGLLVISIVRVPFHVYYYSKLLRDLPVQEADEET